MKQCEECEHPIYRSEVRYELVRGVGKIVCPDCANELRVPWCSGCGARAPADCHCGPLAGNE